MRNPSISQGERGYELLLEHCAALTRVPAPKAPAFQRLEEALGGELARLLTVALGRHRGNRVPI